MFDESWKNWVAAIVSFIIIGLGVWLLVYVAIEEDKRWQQYKVEHNCKVIHHIPAYQQLEYVDQKGNPHFRYIPSKTIYKCDNEEIVER